MQHNDAPHTPGWLRLLETFGLIRAGFVVWLVGLAGLSLNLRFHALFLLSAMACVALVADTLWWKPMRLARNAGLKSPEAPVPDHPSGGGGR